MTLPSGLLRLPRQSFRNAKHAEWTMAHAFFADMGGFILRSPDECDFPLDAAQLFFLVSKGYVQYPDIAKEEIDDRNKYDSLAR